MGGPIKITGVLSGGLMGSDPWDPSSFSGCSVQLFTALKEEGALVRAFGLDISRAEFLLRAAPRWHRNREVWRRRVFQSQGYRHALTRDLVRKIAAEDRDTVVLQVAAYADGPTAYDGIAPVLTYQDGIGAEYWLSPYAPAEITRDSNLRKEHWSFETGVAQGAARVLTCSNYIRRSFVENYRIDADKVVNVGIGLNTIAPKTAPSKDYARPEIVFIGKEFERKGGDLLASAFQEIKRQIPEAVLHVIGPPTRPHSLPDEPSIVFHGFLSRSDPVQAKTFYDVLERASLCVLPSRYEPHGLAPLEAMSYGAAAVVTNDWALAESVHSGITGFLLPALTPEAIASTVVDALSDQTRLKAMSEFAFKTTPERFSWRLVAQKIIACAEEVRAEHRRGQ